MEQETLDGGLVAVTECSVTGALLILCGAGEAGGTVSEKGHLSSDRCPPRLLWDRRSGRSSVRKISVKKCYKMTKRALNGLK